MKTALSGRKIIVIDGCPLACSKACLSNHSVQADFHIDLSRLGVNKKQHEDFDRQQADEMLKYLSEQVQHLNEAKELV